MRLKTCYISIALIAIAALAWLTTDETWYLAFCNKCGLLRSAKIRVCSGFPIDVTVWYPEPEYHRLRVDMGQGACDHTWKACYSNHHYVPEGAVRIPIVLSSYGGLRDRMILLRRLSDRAKISAVLASFDLNCGFDEDFYHACSVIPALDELEDVPAVLSEEEWWSKNKHLFLDRPAYPDLRWDGDDATP